MKHLLKVTKENQSSSFDSTVTFGSLNIIIDIAIERIRRAEADPAAMGTIFYHKRYAWRFTFYLSFAIHSVGLFSLPDKLEVTGVISLRCKHQNKTDIQNEINSWFGTMSDFNRDFCLRFTDDRITYDKVNDKINISFLKSLKALAGKSSFLFFI